jgi:hypothetical protein
MRNMRDKGVFIYTTCSEAIDKDYVTDPRGQAAGTGVQEPYSVKGTVNVSGQVVPMVQHTHDVMMRARAMGDNIVWVSQPEPISNSGAMWEAKDRTGRIQDKYSPTNIRTILDQVYGQERRKQIYAAGAQAASAS